MSLKKISFIRVSSGILMGMILACAPQTAVRERVTHRPSLATLAGRQPATLVWVFSAERSTQDIADAIDTALDCCGRTHLVVAIPAKQLERFTAEQKARLLDLQSQGTIEIGLLPVSGLPLPMLDDFALNLRQAFGVGMDEAKRAPREVIASVDAARLVVATEESWKAQFPGQPLPGLIASLGLADEGFIEAAAASRFAWLIAGAKEGPFGLIDTQPLPVYRACAWDPATTAGGHGAPAIFVIDEGYLVDDKQAQEQVEDAIRWLQDSSSEWQNVDLAYWPATSAADARASRGPSQQRYQHWGDERSL
ncbi:MAG: hypothetical protein AABZ44_03695, partial [Elusimicrobiota bacterium]